MLLQFCVLALEVQLAPESVDVQMFPLRTTAASLLPSLEEAMPYQLCALPTDLSVHAARAGAIAHNERMINA